jgi:uncharacterized delta-60 repeat protein
MLTKKQIKLSVLSCLLLLLLNLSLLAAGILDSTFGNGGKIIFDLGATADAIGSAVLQPDGKIIIAGSTFPSNSTISFADFVVVRLNADGSLDSTFGNGGFVTTDFTGGRDGATSVVLLPDGKIIAAGFAETPLVLNSRGTAYAMIRYNSNGTLDTSFGTGGKVHSDFGAGYQVISKLLIQSDRKILAFGTVSGDSFTIPTRIGLTRYNADGSIDSSFGANGRRFIRFNEAGQFTEGTSFRDAVIQPDGKIIITGDTEVLIPGCVSSMTVNCRTLKSFMFRYAPQMFLDRKFGRRSGKEYGNYNQFWRVFLQSDGKIVIGGNNVKRYWANGRIDRLFSPPIVSNVNFKIHSIAERQKRNLVGCGTLDTSSTSRDVAIASFDENGELIGTDIQNFAALENCNSVLVQTDNKILMFGDTVGTRNSKIFIVRYLDITP